MRERVNKPFPKLQSQFEASAADDIMKTLWQKEKLDPITIPSIVENFHLFVKMFSKSSAADLLYVGKG